MSRVSVQKNPKIEGSVAHDAVDADKPVKVGGIAGAQTDVAINDRVNLALSVAGVPTPLVNNGAAEGAEAAMWERPDGTPVFATAAMAVLGPDGGWDRSKGAGARPRGEIDPRGGDPSRGRG